MSVFHGVEVEGGTAWPCCQHCVDYDAGETICDDAPHLNEPCPEHYCAGGDA